MFPEFYFFFKNSQVKIFKIVISGLEGILQRKKIIHLLYKLDCIKKFTCISGFQNLSGIFIMKLTDMLSIKLFLIRYNSGVIIVSGFDAYIDINCTNFRQDQAEYKEKNQDRPRGKGFISYFSSLEVNHKMSSYKNWLR